MTNSNSLFSWLLHEWRGRLSVTNLSSENTLAMFWLNASVVIMQAKSLPTFWLSKRWQVIFQAHGGNILTFLYITHNHVWYAFTSQMNGLILASILESLLCIFPYMYLLVCASLRLLHRNMNSILRLIQRVYIMSHYCVLYYYCVYSVTILEFLLR